MAGISGVGQHWRAMGAATHGRSPASAFISVEASLQAAAAFDAALQSARLSAEQSARMQDQAAKAIEVARRNAGLSRLDPAVRALSAAVVEQGIVPNNGYDPTDAATGALMRLLADRLLSDPAVSVQPQGAIPIVVDAVRASMRDALRPDQATPEVLDGIDRACADLEAELFARTSAVTSPDQPPPSETPPSDAPGKTPAHDKAAEPHDTGKAEQRGPIVPGLQDPILNDILELLIALLLGTDLDLNDPTAKKLVEALVARLKQVLGPNFSVQKLEQALASISTELSTQLGAKGIRGEEIAKAIVSELRDALLPQAVPSPGERVLDAEQRAA